MYCAFSKRVLHHRVCHVRSLGRTLSTTRKLEDSACLNVEELIVKMDAS